MKKCFRILLLSAAVLTSISLTSCTYIHFDTDFWNYFSDEAEESSGIQSEALTVADIPAFSGTPYVELNNNMPNFTEKDYLDSSFEIYSDLDYLGRCGIAFANIGQELIPTEEREAIGQIKPTGWHTVKYDCVEGKYLYNRCHLIAYNLSGENSNEKNLITGTRYMNITGMLPFEIKVYDYVVDTGNHVLYRVTPVFEGDNLLASGVVMEGWSVEDEGRGICFNVFVYNVQPGIEIDYATGESRLAEDAASEYTSENNPDNTDVSVSNFEYNNSVSDELEYGADLVPDYILNTNSYKFHYPDCEAVAGMSERNKKEYIGDREALIAQGFVPCRICNP